jgi:aminoglycoside phosphotransferase (APT) family kinase protein
MARLQHPFSVPFLLRRKRPAPALCFPRTVAGRSPTEIAVDLLHYLSDRFAAPGLHFAQEPTPVTDGWETFIYHFRLRGAEALPEELRGPLTLRLFAGSQGVPRGRHQYEVQQFLRRHGYPVPAPLLWEERCDTLGGPFMLMEQVPGPTVLRWLLDRPWMVIVEAERMAELQARLHRLPAADFPHPAGPLLGRKLDEIQEIIRRFDLRSLAPGLDWLRARRPQEPASPSIIHLDFHPLNLIHRPWQFPAVLDWDTADVGDPHADVATTLLFLRCGPSAATNWWERLVTWVGRTLLEGCYQFALRRRMALDSGKLSYYLALALLLRLAHCGRFLLAGPEVTGAKPSVVRRLNRDHLDVLCEHFRRVTGVALRLEETAWPARAA